jgi:acetyl esterase
VLFFHQGGLVIMHHLTDDYFCSMLADICSAKVITLEYRRCPEVQFPTPIEYCMVLWTHVQENALALGIDPRRVALAGDSAGGLISAVMTQILRDKGGVQPAAQLLVYPWVASVLEAKGSLVSCAEAFPLTTETMEFFNSQVFPDDKNIDHPWANPLHNDLNDLPPAIIATAGFDPIRDQGNAYGDALKAAGNQVTHYCFSELTHSFLLMGRITHAAERASERLAKDLAQLLGR